MSIQTPRPAKFSEVIERPSVKAFLDELETAAFNGDGVDAAWIEHELRRLGKWSWNLDKPCRWCTKAHGRKYVNR